MCQALGLSTALSKIKGRPYGETAVRRAILTCSRFPDEDEAKKAIEEAGTYHNLSKGTGYGARLSKSMSVPVSLLDHIQAETGAGGQESPQVHRQVPENTEVQEDIAAFINEQPD